MGWKLSGEFAMVTGCASGIGLVTTKLYVKAGATVFGIDINVFPDTFSFAKELAINFCFTSPP